MLAEQAAGNGWAGVIMYGCVRDVDILAETDLGIQAKEMLRTRERLYKIMVEHTGQKIETIAEDCERDKWLDAEEAVTYGTADEVLSHIPHNMGVEKRQNDD